MPEQVTDPSQAEIVQDAPRPPEANIEYKFEFTVMADQTTQFLNERAVEGWNLFQALNTPLAAGSPIAVGNGPLPPPAGPKSRILQPPQPANMAPVIALVWWRPRKAIQ